MDSHYQNVHWECRHYNGCNVNRWAVGGLFYYALQCQNIAFTDEIIDDVCLPNQLVHERVERDLLVHQSTEKDAIRSREIQENQYPSPTSSRSESDKPALFIQ